jgi:CHAT domain-containing protein/tetratricopeptide (TPR) repeat protein
MKKMDDMDKRDNVDNMMYNMKNMDNTDNIKIILFVRFCQVSAIHLDIGLTTEQLICLHKECLEMAKYYNAMSIVVMSIPQLVFLNNSLSRYTDSLLFIKELLHVLGKYGDASDDSVPYMLLTMTYQGLKQYDNAISCCNKWLTIVKKLEDKDSEMQAYLYLGRTYFNLTQYDEAIFFSKKCLDLAMDTNNKSGEILRSYECMMLAYEKLCQYDDAVLYARKCLDIAEITGNKQSEKNAYFVLSRISTALNKYNDVIGYCETIIDIAKQTDEKTAQMNAYLQLGVAHNALRQYEDAIFYTKKYLDIANRIGLKSDFANAYSLLGNMYCTLNHYDEAISYSEKCLKITKKADRDKRFDAFAYITLGKTNKALEKYDDAVLYFEKCIEITKEIGDKQSKVLAYLGLGETYHSIKQDDNAVIYSKKCIELGKEIDERRFEAAAFSTLVNSYQSSNNKDDALLYGKELLDTAKETGDKQTEMRGHLFFAHIYASLCHYGALSLHINEGIKIADELKDNQAKRKFVDLSDYLRVMVGMSEVSAFDGSLCKELTEVPTCREKDLQETLTQARRTNNTYRQYMLLIKLYNYYQSRHQIEQVIECMEQLLELKMGNDMNVFYYIRIGKSYVSMKKYDEAFRYCEDKISKVRQSNNKIAQSLFFTFVGKLYQLRREFNLAEECLREAIQYFELVFVSLGNNDNFKISIFDQYIHCYKSLSIVLINTNQEREALLVSDRCRARALNDLFTSNFGMKQEMNVEEHIEYTNINSLFSSNMFSICFYSICCDGLLVFCLKGENELEFSLTLIKCDVKDPQLSQFIDKAYNEMQVNDVINCENRSLDAGDIQNSQKQDLNKTKLIHLECTNLIEGTSSHPCHLRHDPRGDTTETNDESNNSNALEDLYVIMISQVRRFIKQDEIVIIPDGPLYKVPFAALRDPDTKQYLSETKRIRLAPSITTLKLLTDLPNDLYSKKGALVIGDPSVGKVMLDGEEIDMPPLEGAHIEAIVIANRLDVTPLIGKDATKSAVIEKLQQGVSVVHIAAHGSLSKATIMLAPSEETRATKIPEENDYMLTMADVQKAQVRAQLVVLSCCHSGRGEIRAEGVVGMCRAFLASGARAVVASLWAIDDDATLDFMSLFYFYLKRGNSASTSLQLTMTEMRKCQRFKEPKYWAPFFLIGDDVTINI